VKGNQVLRDGVLRALFTGPLICATTVTILSH
jgi:hypothetical protein